MLMVRLDPGQDLLAGIVEAVAEAGITHGSILAGVGSLSTYHFHVVSTPVMPPENAFIKGKARTTSSPSPAPSSMAGSTPTSPSPTPRSRWAATSKPGAPC